MLYGYIIASSHRHPRRLWTKGFEYPRKLYGNQGERASTTLSIFFAEPKTNRSTSATNVTLQISDYPESSVIAS